MPSLNYFIDNINHSCDTIQNLQFPSSGIFSNAVVIQPEITQLLKDANPSEQSLYKVKQDPGSGDRVLERVDGKSYYKEDGVDEYSNIEGDVGYKRTAVHVPELTGDREPVMLSSETGTSEAVSGDDGKTYRSIIETINKLPVSDEKYIEKIRNMKEEHDELTNDIATLQSEYEENQKLLHSENIYGSDIYDGNLDRALRIEEDRVTELEKKIAEKKAKLQD